MAEEQIKMLVDAHNVYKYSTSPSFYKVENLINCKLGISIDILYTVAYESKIYAGVRGLFV